MGLGGVRERVASADVDVELAGREPAEQLLEAVGQLARLLHLAVEDHVDSAAAKQLEERLGLVELTRPGPFAARTIDFGGYVGIRRAGQLVAMAGRRLQVPGWIEVSAVCTHPDHRGRGLSRRLMNAVIGGIEDAGQLPFLHVVPENPAMSLYERLGFIHHLEATVYALEPNPSALAGRGPGRSAFAVGAVLGPRHAVGGAERGASARSAGAEHI
jgi:ribosomal protein S18 acetylase RimI-like enzyme